MVPRFNRSLGDGFFILEEASMYTSAQIRQKFLDFFVSKGHQIEKGHSLIPYDDPTLLWINSGVAALKPYFDGRIKPQNHRIVNSQKAIRSNDIENVGKTSRHHTFFEMLGNFSIGDYFKKEAIEFAWEFLTSKEWMGMDPDRLYVSIHTDDDEAFTIWTEIIGFPAHKILRTEDNYWQIGDGPCGPNTEIHYDRGEAFDPNQEGDRLFFDEIENDRYVEVWNIVFSQYEGVEGQPRKSYKELPQKNIDTGMGFERLVSIHQQGETNYDTDLFLPIIHKLERISQTQYTEHKEAYRVIADHIRTIVFALSDGALFSNEGRGYVLRRILRRAVRYGLSLDLNKPFMFELVDTVATIMHDFYPELMEKTDLVKSLVKAEEVRFFQTLNDGEKMLEQLMTNDTKVISGQDVFRMYDTYGFPVELTQEIAASRKIEIDYEGYLKAMALQKDQSRASRKDLGSFNVQQEELMNFSTPSKFVGYDHLQTTSKIIALFSQGHFVKQLNAGESGLMITEETPFYAESGGQVGDTGLIFSPFVQAKVLDTQKAPQLQPLHHVEVTQGFLEIGATIDLQVNRFNRELIKRNHSSLHLLQAALIKVLGNHIQQAGSYVSADNGRFDFSHFEKASPLQLEEIESLVNQWIFENRLVTTTWMSNEEAHHLGAIALFEEKYGDQVRVVSMDGVSLEFCGGTHVSNTSELGLFKIVSEESIGSGVRRIVSKTSKYAYQDLMDFEKQMKTLADKIGANSLAKFDEKLNQMINQVDKMKQEIHRLQQQNNVSMLDTLLSQVVEFDGFDSLVFTTDTSVSAGKELVDLLKVRLKNPIIFAVLKQEDQLTLLASLSEAAIKEGFDAGKLVKEAALLADGRGGGRKDFAQAGAKDVSKTQEIMNFVLNIISKHFK